MNGFFSRFGFAVLLVAPLGLQAGALFGTVTAVSRPVPIAGARVLLHQASREFRATTDDAGAYRIADVDAGAPFSLEVSSDEFRVFSQHYDSMPVTAQPLDIRLELLSPHESVVVSGGVISLESNTASTIQTVTRTELQELPSNGRNLTRFALLDPHVRQGVGLGGDGNNASRLSINAGSYRHTSYLLDGVVNYDWIYANGPYASVPVSATEDFQVITSQYGAQYGTTTTGTLRATTRSGTNTLHAEAFDILRPSGIQAAPPLSPFRLPNYREQWGVNSGGALRKDKTFFFGAYEGIHQERGAYIQSPQPSFFVGTDNEHYALGRIDHEFSPDHTLSVRMNGYHYANSNPNDRVSGFNQPNYGRLERTQSWGGLLTDHMVFGSTLNEFRASYTSYFPDGAFPLDPSVGITRPSYSTEGFSTTSWAHAQATDLADTVAFNSGRNSFKMGVDAVRITAKDYSYTAFGTYTFPSGAPKAGVNPINFSQTFGVADLTYGETAFSAFAQDDFRISSRVSANLGVRYEYQSVTNALHNLGPRAGLAWDVKGDGKTVVRGGAGMFYDQLYLYVYRRFYLLGPNAPTTSFTIPYGAAGFPTFPNSLSAPPTGASAGRLNLYLPAKDLLNPYSLQFSLGFERQLGRHFALTVDGLHVHTLKQYRVNDINHPSPFVRTASGQIRSGTAADASRPYSTYDGVPVRDVGVIENSSSSLYDSLDIGIKRKFDRRLQLEAHYVLASSATYSMFYADANSGIPNDWNNWGSNERAPSDFFQHQRFVGSSSVVLPYRLRFGTIVTLASGLPVNPLTGHDNNGDTYSSDRPIGFGRNSFRGPMQQSVDASLGRGFRFGERWRAELRGEIFNLLNHNNYITLNSVYGEGPLPSSTFLHPIAGIQNVDPSRQIQFVLRVGF